MKPLILIVEDEAALQKLLAYNLEAAGFAVVQAFDGEEAQTLIDERAPDLVLLDWMLPQLSGLELCRRLKQEARTEWMPKIMLTARGYHLEPQDTENSGILKMLSKPFSPRQLLAKINEFLP